MVRLIRKRAWRLPPIGLPRLLFWLASLVLLAGVTGSAVWAWLQYQGPAVLPLRVVGIDGELQHLRRADLEAAVAEHVREGFFTVDMRAVRQAAERLPWVEAVAVRRVWPDTLVLTVAEQTPLARWGDGGMITAGGALFFPRQGEIPRELPRLNGPEGSAGEMAARYLTVRGRLDGLGLQVESLAMDRRGAWSMRLREREGEQIDVRLGRHEFEARLRRLIRVYPLLRARRSAPLLTVDLRYANGLSVRWREDGPFGSTRDFARVREIPKGAGRPA